MVVLRTNIIKIKAISLTIGEPKKSSMASRVCATKL